MTTQQLLKELNALTHADRSRRTYELGLDPQNRAVIDELEIGDSFARRLAVMTISGSRDAERAMRLSTDASRAVRRRAQKFLVQIGSTEQVVTILSGLNAPAQRGLVRLLVKYRRNDAIEVLLESAHSSKERWLQLAPYISREKIEAWVAANFEKVFPSGQVTEEQWALLPYVSKDKTAEWLDTNFNATAGDLAHYRLWEWRRLASNHPQYAFEKLLEQAQAITQNDGLLVKQVNWAIKGIAEWQSDRAIELVKALIAYARLDTISIDEVLPYNAEAVAQLVLGYQGKISIDFSEAVARLQNDTIVQLLEKRPETLENRAHWLKKLAPKFRGELWEKFGRGWRDQHGAVDFATLGLLPRAIRQVEGLRHLELPALAATPVTWLPYVPLLDFDLALKKMAPVLGDPLPDLRAAAHRALAGCVRFARPRVTDYLQIVRQRGNEQDPVRSAMLEGLANLPPSVWNEAHLETLATIQRQALDARDLSSSTASHLERLIVSLLPHFPVWAAAQLAVLVKERGHVSFWSLQDRITDAQMRVIGPAIYPILQSWTQRDHYPFLAAMGSFGRRLKVWDEGVQLLVDYINTGPTSQITSAVAILAEHRRDVFAGLVPQLLKSDESWGTQPIIYSHIHYKRQDLWTPALLGRVPLRGRFQTGKTRFVPAVRDCFYRWSAEQQEMFALSLAEVINDPKRDTPTAIDAIIRLAALPDIDARPLLQLAALENARLPLREAALRVLSRLDGGQGVPTLIEALDDERARIAIYSLRRSLIEMPANRALEILRATPLQRVTVAKEVLRLLGDLKSGEALDLLFEFSTRELHRDVRVALLRALWEHLENERTWTILEEAADSTDVAIARMAARTPATGLSRTARIRLNGLLARLLTHSESQVRLEVLRNGTMGTLSDPEKQLRAPLFAALESKLRDEYLLAARVIWTTYAGSESEMVSDSIRLLLPRRRALSNVLKQAQYHLRDETGQAVLAVLATDALVLSTRLDLAATILAPAQFAAIVEMELEAGTLHAEALMQLVKLLESGFSYSAPVETLDYLLVNWSTSPRPELRRIALATLVARARDSYGWTPERLTALEKFRSDETPLVAAAAQWVFPNAEETE